METARNFKKTIEQTVEDEGITYLEAVIDYCYKHNIEESVMAKLITGSLKEQVEIDAKNLKLLKDQ